MFRSFQYGKRQGWSLVHQKLRTFVPLPIIRLHRLARTNKELFISELYPLSIGAGEGNGNPLKSSYLEDFMDRKGWQVSAHGVTEMDTIE